MGERVLITGGAGFIGSHPADELLAVGYEVRVRDNFLPRVPGHTDRPPSYPAREVEFVRGDVRDSPAVRQALAGVRAVFHFAAAVGVGQSTYEMERYAGINTPGTAALLQSIIGRPVDRAEQAALELEQRGLTL
jgi:dTDP-L-rhamnose 4-epimerase